MYIRGRITKGYKEKEEQKGQREESEFNRKCAYEKVE